MVHTYTPELVNGFLARLDQFPITELWLMDIDEERLNIVGKFAQRMVAGKGSPFKVVLSTNQREAIADASYVTTQLRVGHMEARRRDEYLGLRHGLIGQETTGIGGMAKALADELQRRVSALVAHTDQAQCRNWRRRVVAECTEPEEELPPRIVSREGIVRATTNIQAPTRFALVSPETKRLMNYLYTTSPNLDLQRYKGIRIIVTGEETMDERWGNTPLITIQRIQPVSE